MGQEEDLISGPWSWTKEDIKLLKRLYPHGNTRKIAKRLGRPLTAVRQKAYDIGLKTSIYQYWSKEDLLELAKLYPHTPTSELAERLSRSAGSIKTKARELGLKKTEDYMKQIKSRPRKGRKSQSQTK